MQRDSRETLLTEGSPAGAGETTALAPDARPGAQSSDIDTAHELVLRFIEWLDAFGDRSYDPHDVWAWSLGRRAKRLYYRSPRAGALVVAPLVALDALLPSSRRLVTSPRRYPIADAHYAAGFFHWGTATGDDRATERGVHFLDELERSRCEGFEEFCWGYPFDWESRSGTIAAGTPLITTVPYVYEAFERGHEATGRAHYLAVMESIAAFAADRIPVTELEDGSAAAGYTPSAHTTVVNASAYRGFLLGTAGQRFRRADWAREAERNIAFVLGAQRADGSWPYATMAGDAFVDNFHTCLVLKNLFKFSRLADRADVLDAVVRGYAFYRRSLLDRRLRPIPFAVKPRMTLYRADLYDYAEGINLAVLLRDVDTDAPSILSAMLHELRNEWATTDGHFVTRRMLVGRNTIPYHRWGQSQTFHALAVFSGSASA
jgi:hypothetical protein